MKFIKICKFRGAIIFIYTKCVIKTTKNDYQNIQPKTIPTHKYKQKRSKRKIQKIFHVELNVKKNEMYQRQEEIKFAEKLREEIKENDKIISE